LFASFIGAAVQAKAPARGGRKRAPIEAAE
jgi:hypothetical protein